ncbi:MAG: bifunctional UDP-3-O-[3-hydroxymyristoyl] N-acetylglucosamine deacetylase/3-hydroxyacyl-ACP dehydratase [Candidatus Marinimicrobia bacterium]|nr:bifunctional UDP-3-O-[3-hydroxymyristoyl] N-acetylglucosamine deacetylase/3-hydroxyacyl-ACP dehydratase [Candidatus Neomarinimicrobiota bacterium]
MAGFQQTIAESASISGTGLHTGVDCVATFRPGEIDQGIRFVRADLPDSPQIPADIDHVADISRGTTLELDGVRVHTVEHILAAAAGLGIDNLIVELSAKEPPVMDGSARPFVEVLLKAGLTKQNAPRRTLVVDQTVSFADPDAGIDLHVLPADEFRITFMMDYGHLNQLATQFMSVYAMHEDFVERIAPARTFCLLSEVLELHERGLAKGGSLENAIVVRGDSVMSKEPMRFKEEFARHKILDLIGDLMLSGKRIMGHVIAVKPGHGPNTEMARRLASDFGNLMSMVPPVNIPTGKSVMDITEVQRVLPHRYPFLMLDRVVDFEGDNKCTGIKQVTVNEPYFQGHFPDHPIMPGVLQLEAMAQVSSILLLRQEGNQGKIGYFMSADKVKFRKPVFPGDTLFIEAEILKIRGSIGVAVARCVVNDVVVSQANLKFALMDV